MDSLGLERHGVTDFTGRLWPVGVRAQEPVNTGPFLYVTNQDAATVSVIDTKENTVVATIDLVGLGFPPNSKPHHVAVEPDGSFWYVSLIAAGKVLKFTRENELVDQADFETPGMLALHPTEDLLFVGRSMAAVNPPQRIGMLTRSDMEMEELGVFFPRPHAMAIDGSGEYVFSASLAANQMGALYFEEEDLTLQELEGPTHVIVQFAVSPDGRYLVGTAQLTGKLLVFDLSAPDSPALIQAVAVNAGPWHPQFSPDGDFVYFGNQEANTVTVVRTEDWTVDAVIEGNGLAEPHGIAVAPDGRHVYVSNRNLAGNYVPANDPGEGNRPGTVVVIDTETREIVSVIEVGKYAAGMGIQSNR